MNKYQPQVDPNEVWNNVQLYTYISHDLAETLGNGLGGAKKIVDSKNLVTISKTIGTKFETIGNAITKIAGNKSVINTLDTIGNTVGVVGGVLGGVADIARLAQDKNTTPWDYVGAGVKAAKNVTENIPILKNIMHVADLGFNGVNEAVEMAKDENTNWVDWTRYGVGKVMDVLTFIPHINQIISFIGSGVDFFLQGMSQLWNINKIKNKIRLENANAEARFNTEQRWNALMKKKKEERDKALKELADRQKATEY
jgi:hypothetical protein